MKINGFVIFHGNLSFFYANLFPANPQTWSGPGDLPEGVACIFGGNSVWFEPFLSHSVQEFFPASLSHICYMRAAEQKFLVDATSVSLWISLWSLTNNHRWYL